MCKNTFVKYNSSQGSTCCDTSTSKYNLEVLEANNGVLILCDEDGEVLKRVKLTGGQL